MKVQSSSVIKEYISPFSTIAGANLLATGISLVIGMYLVRQFIPEDYGQFTYLLTRFGFFRLLATFGMGSIVTYHIAQNLKKRDNAQLNISYYSFLAIRLAVAVVLLIICLLLAVILKDNSYYLLILLVVPASIGDFNLAVLQGNINVIPVSITLLTQPLSYAIFAYIFVNLDPELSAIYFALILSYFLYLLGSSLWIKNLPIGAIKYGSLNQELSRSTIKIFANSFILVILQFLFGVIPIYLLGYWSLFSIAALLGVVLNLIILPVGLIQVPVASVFQPRFSRLYNPIDIEAAKNLLTDFLLFIFRLTVIITVICAGFADTIVALLFGNQYIDSVIPLMVLSPIIILLSLQYIITLTLMITHQPRKAIPGLFIQLILVFILSIAVMEIYSSNIVYLAGCQVFSAFVGTYILFFVFQKQFRLNWHVNEFLIATFAAIFSLIVSKFIFYWIRSGLVFDILAISMTGILYLLLMSKRFFGQSVFGLALLRLQTKR